jgi:hypothetical protein
MDHLVSTISRQSVIVDSFSSITLVNDREETVKNEFPKPEQVPTWFGYTLTEGSSANYLAARASLSHAAYWGDWTSLFDQLKRAETGYQENWINCPRISKYN